MKNKKSTLTNSRNIDDEQRTSIIKLVGLFIMVYCIVAVTNGLGNYLRMPFTYLFGSLGIIMLIPIMLIIGLFMFISHKKFDIFSKVQYIIIGLILIFSTLLSSILTPISNGTIIKFVESFQVYGKTFSDYSGSIDEIASLGGGMIGFMLMGIFNTLTNSNTVTLIITIILLSGFVIILFAPYVKRFVLFCKSKNQKRKEKKAFKIANQVKIKPSKKSNYVKVGEVENIETIDFNLQDEKASDKKQKEYEACVEEKQIKVTGNNYEYTEIKQDNKKPLKSIIGVFDDEIYSSKKNSVNDYRANSNNNVKIANVFDNDFKVEEKPQVKIDNSIPNAFVSSEVKISSNEETTPILNQDIRPNEFKFESQTLIKKEVVEQQVVNETLKSTDKESSVDKNVVNKPVIDMSTFPYDLPPLYLLKEASDNGTNQRNEEIARQKAEVLTNKIRELNVDAQITNFVVGPSVTRYEITLAAGVRVNSFVNLQEDFKLALGVNSIRIEAPIPGKSAIGIEVPNNFRAMVSMKEIIASLPPKRHKLYVPVGKDIGGVPISIAICDMPHCLISGATNSGKSVCANTIILSLLMNYRPNEVRMIMVDPKRVEMLFYTDIPHLMCPIITDSTKAFVALDKLCKIMMNRFDIFSMEGVKNIATYNEKMTSSGKSKMSFILLVVDELAELMLSKKASLVEERIQKLVQLGRAAGIHLILSTQRPDVNVITGTIKSNIPCRMTFRLSSLVDSRTVIDVGGAEKLLNNGDMLLLTPEYTGLRRVQGVYVSDAEITDVVNHCKKQMPPQYDPDFLDLRTDEEKQEEINMQNALYNGNNKDSKSSSDDAMYEDIKRCILAENKASTSFIQRKFGLGYGKAARMIDRLEEDGLIGPENGTKGREVYGAISENEELEEDEKN